MRRIQSDVQHDPKLQKALAKAKQEINKFWKMQGIPMKGPQDSQWLRDVLGAGS